MSYRLGLDIGIASCGWSVLKTNHDGLPYKIIALDSVVFPKGETAKTGESLSAKRRQYRSSRRLTRRSKRRKARVAKLFIRSDLLTKSQLHRVFLGKLPSIYKLRDYALSHKLTNSELFRVLYYFAGHRGFHSNRKYARKNAGKLIKSIHKAQDRLKQKNYKTFGEMLYRDDKFKHQKRNRYGQFLVNASRSMIINEATTILHIQHQFNSNLTPEFMKQYIHILSAQRNFDVGPGKQSPYAGNQIEMMIGRDTLDHTQVRAAKATYTFKYYQLLTKLSTLKYKQSRHNYKSLNQAQKKVLVKLSFEHNKVNYKQIIKALKLNKQTKFNLVDYPKFNNSANFISLISVLKIIHILPKRLQHDHKLIDSIGEILTKFDSDETRIKAFKDAKLPISKKVISKLIELNYSKFGRLSLRTMRNLIPYLEHGYNLYDSIHKAGYHTQNKLDLHYIHSTITNPVVMRAFTITRKVVKAVINKFGQPDYINVELARDLAKSHQARMKVRRYQKNRQSQNQATCDKLRRLGVPINGQNILIYNLYKEQHGIDPYTNRHFNVMTAFNGNLMNIDHIVPYSWTFNDSYNNKVLVSRKANDDKANRLPLQYLTSAKSRQNLIKFAKKLPNYKKRERLLKKNITSQQLDRWKTRNINDTRWVTKLIANYLAQNVSFSKNKRLGKIRVIRSNGSMTAKLRNRWGLNKVRADGDKHHALDATVIASITPKLINYINNLAKYRELQNNPKLWKVNHFTDIKQRLANNKIFQQVFNDFPLPWHDFRKELIARLSDDPTDVMKGQMWDAYTSFDIIDSRPVHVVHVANHHLNGKVSGDTLRSAKFLDKGLVMNRVPVTKLKLNKKGEIKAGFFKYRINDGNQADAHELIRQMSNHFNSGAKAFKHGYMSYRDRYNHRHVIKKVKMFKKVHVSGVICNDGTATKDNGKVVKINLYWNSKSHKYEFVPIYLKSMVSSKLPDIISSASSKVHHLTKDDKYLFNLKPYTPIHIKFKHPRNIKWIAPDHPDYDKVTDFYGYYLKPNATNGSINCVSFDRSYKIFSIGLSTIDQIDKLSINYLGDCSSVTPK